MRSIKIYHFLVYALLLHASNNPCGASYEEYYRNALKFPKCCPTGHHFLNETLECVKTHTNHIFNVAAAAKNFTECQACMEVLDKNVVKVNCDDLPFSKLEEHRFFPKCCPVAHSYDPRKHKCVQELSNQTIDDYIRVDLSNCSDVIVDYVDAEFLVRNESLAVVVNGYKEFRYGDYCWEKVFNNSNQVLRVCEAPSVCKTKNNPSGITCVPKCCPDGHMYTKGCQPAYSHGVDPKTLESDYAVIQAISKPKHPVNANINIDRFGVLHFKGNLYDITKYCLEYHSTPAGTSQKIFMYLDDQPVLEDVKFNFRKVMVTISCVFLFLTIVCYMLLPEMRENLYGKCVMIYCSIFLFGFAILTYINFDGNTMTRTACATIGFLLIFCLLGTFSWLNIICFDMWMAFGQIRVRTMRSKRSDCKKLIYYNLYGWGVPTVITLFIFSMTTVSWLPEYLMPHVGQKECFLEKEVGSYSHMAFFLAPMSLLVLSNFILFMKTILYCFKVKNEINRMKDSVPGEKAKRNKTLNADKEKLSMMIKLFVIMGITWLFEIMTSFISFKDNYALTYIELFGDCVNTLQGFFIFCILVLKRKVLSSLKNRHFRKLIRKTSQSSTTMTSVYSYVRNKDNATNRTTIESRQ